MMQGDVWWGGSERMEQPALNRQVVDQTIGGVDVLFGQQRVDLLRRQCRAELAESLPALCRGELVPVGITALGSRAQFVAQGCEQGLATRMFRIETGGGPEAVAHLIRQGIWIAKNRAEAR